MHAHTHSSFYGKFYCPCFSLSFPLLLLLPKCNLGFLAFQEFPRISSSIVACLLLSRHPYTMSFSWSFSHPPPTPALGRLRWGVHSTLMPQGWPTASQPGNDIRLLPESVLFLLRLELWGKGFKHQFIFEWKSVKVNPRLTGRRWGGGVRK